MAIGMSDLKQAIWPARTVPPCDGVACAQFTAVAQFTSAERYTWANTRHLRLQFRGRARAGCALTGESMDEVWEAQEQERTVQRIFDP